LQINWNIFFHFFSAKFLLHDLFSNFYNKCVNFCTDCLSLLFLFIYYMFCVSGDYCLYFLKRRLCKDNARLKFRVLVERNVEEPRRAEKLTLFVCKVVHFRAAWANDFLKKCAYFSVKARRKEIGTNLKIVERVWLKKNEREDLLNSWIYYFKKVIHVLCINTSTTLVSFYDTKTIISRAHK